MKKVIDRMHTIADLYSDALLNKDIEAGFNNYYNVEFREGFTMPMHSHEYIEIMYARKGSCQVFVNEDKYRLEPGDFILLNGGVPHKLFVSKDTPCRVLCLEFYFTGRRGNNPFLRYVFNNMQIVGDFLKCRMDVIKMEDAAEIYSLLNDICRELERSEPGKLVYIQAAFSQLVIKIARLSAEARNSQGSSIDRYVRDAIAYMYDNYHEELSMKQLARHVNLNVSYFHKIFKNITGSTPSDYLTGIRVKKAENLLGMSDLSVVDIAGITGFNSRQYFDYIFKNQRGMTPSEYRRSYKLGRKPVGEEQ